MHGAGPDQRVVKTDIELMRLRGNPLEPSGHPALFWPHLEQILAIGWKVIAKRGATTSAERQVVTDADALVAVSRHEDGLWSRCPPRTPQRHLADFCRRPQISLGECGRERERVSVIVEPIG